MGGAQEIVSRPEMLVHRFDADRAVFEFLELSRKKVSETPFLREDVLGDDLKRSQAALKDISSILLPQSPPPNYIFHSAFCCSTLLARALDFEGKNLSLREPEIFMELSNLKRTGNPIHRDQAQWKNLFGTCLRLLSRPFKDGERILIKPTNAANNLLEDVLARDDGSKVVLLHAGLRSFLISILKKGEEGRGFARKLFFIFQMDSRFAKGWPLETVSRMTDLQLAAVVWRMQMNGFLNALERFASNRIRSLDSEDLLAGPEAVLGRLDDYFGLGLGPDTVSRIAGSDLFQQHSKFADRTYDTSVRAEENERIEAEHGPALDQIIEWEGNLIPGQPVPQPLPNTILAL